MYMIMLFEKLQEAISMKEEEEVESLVFLIHTLMTQILEY